MLVGLMIKIMGTFADLGLPRVLAYILDHVIPKGRVELIGLWGGVMVALAIMARQFNIRANRMASKVARDTVQCIRHDLFAKINDLSGANVDELTVPSLISRMTSDTYNIHHMIGMMQRLGVRAPIILIGGIIITATLEPVLTLVLVAVLPLLAFGVYQISKHGIPLFSKVQQSADKMVQVVRESISGIRVIKALSKTEYEKERFRKINEELVKKDIRANSIMALSSPMMNLLLNAGLTLVVVAGAFRVNSGACAPGTIVAFLSYFTMILNAMITITRIFVMYSKASASADRITEVLEYESDLKVLEDRYAAELSACEGKEKYKIEFEDVSFAYPVSKNEGSEDENKNCLEHISFAIREGESLGIIGSTGSGKSTIVNLMMRFYDATKGMVKIDGKDIRSYCLQDLRSKFGAAFQNDVIFNDTIFENISFGRDLSKESVEQGAKDACADGYIREKEEGYEHVAAIKGANLSGGQKQRLLIARALANHPEILVLDDSSSALDYKTDAMLRQAIRKNYDDATIVMIAQRISSVMYMDHILVLEDGEMIGYGTHEELMDSCEVYKEIYESQMGNGITA
ncbi:MAG: ABC transporter ATP-binding protein [Lachnospiraceae bacterium]|nr:ABC transporter ATP-binding protein [Lachnospiraceae bacterium]